MEIDVKDYISEDKMIEIAEDTFREQCLRHFRDEERFERILKSLSYSIVRDLVDKEIKGDVAETIKEGVVECINEKDYSYHIFREKTRWNDNSIAQTLLNKAVIDNSKLIGDKCKEAVSKLAHEDIKVYISDAVSCFVEDNLFKKEKD